MTGHLSSFVTAVTSVRGTHGTVVFPLSLHNESWAVNNHPGHSGPAPFRGKSKSAQRFIRLIPGNNTAAVNFSRSLQKEAANPRMLVQCFFTKIREGRFSPLNKRFVSVMELANMLNSFDPQKTGLMDAFFIGQLFPLRKEKITVTQSSPPAIANATLIHK